MTIFQGGGGPPSVPGSGLPDLDAARQIQSSEPVAPAPIASNQGCTDCTPCPTCGPGSANHAPVVSAGGPYYGTAATTTVFNGLGSFDVDPGDGISDYAWSFGDNTAVAHGATPSHTYQASGNYTVTLTVTDRHSTTRTTSTTAAVTAAATPTPSPSPGSAQGNAAAFVSQSVPATTTAGQRYPVSVTMRNTGSTTWSAAHLYRLGSQNPQDNGNWGRGRVYLPADTAPGAEVTFSFNVSAPFGTALTTAVVDFQWQMVQDGVQWFGESHNDAVMVYTGATVSGMAQTGPGDFYNARLEPINRTGAPGEDLLSGNFNWGLDALNLAGRAALNLSLPLSYNSLVWTRFTQRDAPVFFFDADRGFPSPGFRLGFPSIQGPFTNEQAQSNSYLMIMPSGARVELRQMGSSNVYESVDSSYLQLSDGENGSLVVRSPDGSQLAYWSINSEYRCTEIKDRNGNYISIKYDPINGTANLGRITSVLDTLGRTISFNYDSNFRLQTITQMRNGIAHVWASFGYSDLDVRTQFVGQTDPNGEASKDGLPPATVLGLPDGNTVSVLTQVGLDDGSRYNFDYTSWGQIYRIHHYAADGHQLNYTSYNLPLDPSPAQSDCPKFTERQDWVENWNDSSPVATTFQSDPNGLWGQVTSAPRTSKQVSYREYSSKAYGDWTRGLVTGTEIRDETDAVKKTTITSWERDFTGVSYAVNPRPKRITISDSEGNRRQTSIEYTSFGLPVEVFEQGPLNTSDWAILRRTHTDYDLSPEYVNRHILGLVQGQYLFAADAPNSPAVQTLMSKTTYEYDVDTGICTDLCADYAAAANSPSIVQHDGANYGSDFVVGRGALTRVRRWDAGDEWNESESESKRITSRMHYNSLGSAIRSSDPLGHQTTIGYADQFSVDGTGVSNPALVTLSYPTSTTDPDGYSSSARYNYDLGVMTRAQDPKGAAQTTQYDSAGRVRQVTNTVNGAHSRMVYPASQTILVSATTVTDLAHEAFSFRVFDGAGRVRATASDFPDSTPHYSGQYTSYDILGRAVPQSNPIEITGGWVATGADATAQGGFGWVFSTQSYDWKGRPLVTTNTDGTTKEANYGGCGCAGGEVMTVTDEGTLVNGGTKKRQQKIYSDSLGRTVKTEVLNWDGAGNFGTGGSIYSTTVNTYNARDQITQVRQYAGAEGSASHQDTTMTYDGHGRLWKRHAPGQQVDPNNSSSTDHSTITYNSDDTILTATDARGAATTLTYNARRLVTHVSYAVPTVNPPGSAIPVPPAVAYSYDAAGNREWMDEDNQRRVTYHYDVLSRMEWEDRQLPGLPDVYRLSYEYNLAGEVKNVTDQTAGTSFSTSYDTTGRINEVNTVGYGGSMMQFASQIQYRAWGAVKSMAYGNNTSLSIGYNARGQIANYSVSGAIAQWFVPPQPVTIAASYEYHPDGQVKFVQGQTGTNSLRDRAYQYDNAGRLNEAYSGTEARNFVNNTTGGTADGPYRQSYTFDTWDNMLTGGGRYWSRDSVIAVNYNQFNRNPNWGYDAESNLISRNEPPEPAYAPHYSYDAAGRDVSVTYSQACIIQPQGLPQFNAYTTTQTYDGDGQMVRYVRSRTVNGSMAAGWPVTNYYLRSTVLGGRVISSYDGEGAWGATEVYAGSERIGALSGSAEAGPFSTFRYADPVTGDAVATMKNNTFSSFSSQSTLDSNGVDVPLADPFPPEGGGGNGCIIWDDGALEESATIIPGLEDTSRCILDGIPMDCSFVRGESSVACPNNDCSPVAATFNIRYGGGRRETYKGFVSPFLLPRGSNITLTGGVAVVAGAWFHHDVDRGFEYGVLSAMVAAAIAASGNSDRPSAQYYFADPQNSGFKLDGAPFTPGQRKILRDSYERVNQSDCTKFINATLAKYKVGKEFNSLDKLLNKATFSFYDVDSNPNYTAAELGVDIESTILLRDSFVNRGASAVTTSGTHVFLSAKVFDRPILRYFGRTADTPSSIVHELFHVAGIDRSIVDSQQLTDEIRANCRLLGSDRIILNH